MTQLDKLIGKRMRGEDKKPRCITGHKWWPSLPLEERFWRKVDKKSDNECWEWMGALFKNGYGAFSPKASVTFRAHKFGYELINGHIPDGMILRHTCDNPPCCNPNHLLLGTHKDNAKDRIERGRSSREGGKGRTLLSPDDVMKIVEMRKNGVQRPVVAKLFNITDNTVTGICRGRSWANVTGITH